MAAQDQTQMFIEAYRNILVSWQVPLTKEVQAFMNQLAQQKMNTSQFVTAFRQTKAYAQKFPGIFRRDGTMRMTETQYISGYNSSRDFAASLGRRLSPQAYGLAIKNGNSPSEIKMKLTVADKLKEFRPQLNQFNEYLLATGKIKKPLGRKDLEDFLMKRRGDLEREWDIANTSFKLQAQAGFDVGKPKTGADMSFKNLDKTLKRFKALGGNVQDVDFAEMGRLIRDVIPKSDLYGMGIREKDIVQMAFNGKNANAIADKVSQVLTTYQLAVTEEGAQAPTYAGEVRLGTPGKGSE